jgi:hypothetical protein
MGHSLSYEAKLSWSRIFLPSMEHAKIQGKNNVCTYAVKFYTGYQPTVQFVIRQ